MRIHYHEGIYYPAEKDKLESLVFPIEKRAAASALIVPHQALSLSASLLREAFSHFGEPSSVVILSPIHAGRIESDRDYPFFEGDENTGDGIVKLGAVTAEYYAEEDAAAEILLPFIRTLSPSVPVSIIYTDIRNAKESRALSSFLAEKTSPDTLFIISTNLSSLCSTIEECREWMERAVEALERGENILDCGNRNRVHICAGGAVDSINRIVPGPWIFEDSAEGETTAHAVLWKEK